MFMLIMLFLQGGGALISSLVPMLLIIGVFYILLIRPQQARQRKLQETISALKAGDRIVTTGGVIGTITSVKDTSLLIRSADKTILEISRGSVAGLDEETKA
ncbi:MAG TPA: preprotein translocase subunit YajC [Pyrinomonadaceae bacterium]|nr:preprotein translocase subunit YajC [Pyrinomonadaceae bacterium]